MRPLLSIDDMRQADAEAIHRFGISPDVLMDHAARSVCDAMEVFLPPSARSVLILCGPGNNGGDGFALARWLADSHHVTVVRTAPPERYSPEARAALDRCLACGVAVQECLTAEQAHALTIQADVVVDALLGTGAALPLREPMPTLVSKLQDSTATVVSIDIPTGICADTGAVPGPCVQAHLTVTLGALKKGMFLSPASRLCGAVKVGSIGAPSAAFASHAKIYLPDAEDAQAALPCRRRHSSKFDYGTVVVVGGCQSMPGAPSLSATAAIRSGAGLVTLIAPAIHPLTPPEIMTSTAEVENDDGEVHRRIERATALVIGPGMGARAAAVLPPLLALRRSCPAVVDADALRHLPSLSELAESDIATPHAGEFAAMLGIERSSVEQDPDKAIAMYRTRCKAVCILKTYPVRVITPDAEYWIAEGNPGMATAGSGDVLAGIAGALLGRGIPAPQAALLAAWLHARAGSHAATKYGMEATTASSLLESISSAFLELERNAC